MVGKQRGMDDDRFLPFLDMVRILNFLQAKQCVSSLYSCENTWPGQKGQYPRIAKASGMIRSFSGALVIVDASRIAIRGASCSPFFYHFLLPGILQDGTQRAILPSPHPAEILLPYHVPTTPGQKSGPPFITHNCIGPPRVCFPTIVTFPYNHAYMPRANGDSGEGQP